MRVPAMRFVVTDFIMLMLPYSVASLVLLMICGVVFVKKAPVTLQEKSKFHRTSKDKKMIGMYILTFVVSILMVVNVIHYALGLLIVVLLTLVFD